MAANNTFDTVSLLISVDDLDELEGRIGCHLPASFREHYLSVNGGAPFDSLILEENTWEPLDVAMFLPIKYPYADEPMFEMFKNYDALCALNIIPHDLLPFARDHGENFFCLNLGDETIVYYEPYYASPLLSPEENHTRSQRRVADSFDHFLHSMQPIPDPVASDTSQL